MAKARQFVEAAETVEALADDANDVADAYVTLCVHAGIAAADVICCRRLGEHKAGYSAVPASGSDYKRAGRAARALVEEAARP